MADNLNPSSPPAGRVFHRRPATGFFAPLNSRPLSSRKPWHVAARGEHALVIAPTGSGKTLAAFLYALDQLFREGGEDTREAHKRKTLTHPLYFTDQSSGHRRSAQLADPVTGYCR